MRWSLVWYDAYAQWEIEKLRRGAPGTRGPPWGTQGPQRGTQGLQKGIQGLSQGVWDFLFDIGGFGGPSWDAKPSQEGRQKRT